MGAETFELRYCCVACLDVLGQGEKLRGMRKLPDSPDLNEEFMDGLRSTLGSVLKVREDIESFFAASKDAHGERPNSMLYQAVPPNLREEVLEVLAPHTKFKYFSDTIIIYSPLMDEKGSALLSDIYLMLSACAMEMLTSLARKSPIRGGIEVGPLVRWEEEEMYGPALYFAHALESRIAKYPRIAVGTTILEILEIAAKQDTRDNHLKVTERFLAQKALGLITTDEEGVAFVDFLGPGMAELRAPANLSPLVERVYVFVQEEVERFEKDRNQKLHDRYLRLNDYLNFRREHWPI